MTTSLMRQMLFSAPMVRALLAGTKTQTRRALRIQPSDEDGDLLCDTYCPTIVRGGEEEPGPEAFGAFTRDGSWALRCPYGAPADRLWVRETWARDDEDGCLMYRADLGLDANADAWEQGRIEGVPRCRWRPSIHMPRWASRITLEVTGVRVERLKDLTREDAIAEGIVQQPDGGWGLADTTHYHPEDPRQSYFSLFEAINGPGSVEANPWLWVVSFPRSA